MRSLLLSVVASASLLAACQGDVADSAEDTGNFSSNQATLLDFEFDGELVTDITYTPESVVKAQLLYTIGHLNQQNSVGRLDAVELTKVESTEANDKTTIKYHAKLPVAWGSKENLPTKYEFLLPRDMSFEGLKAFVKKYTDRCTEEGAHDVDGSSMWYYYRPERSGCDVAQTAGTVIRASATITKSKLNTKNKYPEYHQVWADDRLEVIAVFGKYESTGGDGDAGVDAFNTFVRTTRDKLKKFEFKSEPANVADYAGPGVADVTFEAKRPDGKTIKITALLVNAITEAKPEFDKRYQSLTETADLITYNGHAGLGQNVRALAAKGKWAAKKYQIFFMNGCDTFAYVDGTLAKERAKLNPDDPAGTKYMEFITNAMPTYFSSMSAGTTTLIDGLASTTAPQKYDEIFNGIDRKEVVLVTGEEDNVFKPGMKIGK